MGVWRSLRTAAVAAYQRICMRRPNPDNDLLLYSSQAAARNNMMQFVEARRARDLDAMLTGMRGTPIQVMYEAAIRVLDLTPGLLALVGVTSTATQVLYARSGHHTRERHPHDVPDVYHELPKSRLAYIGTRESDKGLFELVFLTLAGRPIFMAIKFVPAGRPTNRSGVDQCWASTLGFRGADDVFRLLRKRSIRPVTRRERADVGAIHSGPI